MTRVTPTDARDTWCPGSGSEEIPRSRENRDSLATGGYTANVEARSKYDEIDPRNHLHRAANPYGDGLDTRDRGRVLFGGGKALGRSSSTWIKVLHDPFSGGRLTELRQADVYLDESGHRFVAETSSDEADFSGGVKLPEENHTASGS